MLTLPKESSLGLERYYFVLRHFFDPLTVMIQDMIVYPISPSLLNVGIIHIKPEEFGLPRPKPSVTPASRQDVIDLVQGFEDDITKVAEVRHIIWIITTRPISSYDTT